MKVKSLKEYLQGCDDEANVVVLTNENVFGGRPSVKITGIETGMDWDKGTVFLHPATGLIKKEVVK